jgi:hypothetical protein
LTPEASIKSELNSSNSKNKFGSKDQVFITKSKFTLNIPVRKLGYNLCLSLKMHNTNLEPIWIPVGRNESNLEKAMTTTAPTTAKGFVNEVLFYGAC